MAVTKGMHPELAVGMKLVRIGGVIVPSSSSACTQRGQGFSVVRTSAGLFTVTFDEPLKRVVSCKASMREADGRVVRAQAGDYVAASRTLEIRVDKPKGVIQLPLGAARVLSTNATQNLAAHGGIVASNSTPIFDVITSAKELGLNWAASGSPEPEIAWAVAVPSDFDETEAAVLYHRSRMAKSGGSLVDHPAVTVQAFFGINGTDAGQASPTHVTSETVANVSNTFVTANQTAGPTNLTVCIVPAPHTTDALQMLAVWIEYTKKVALFDPAASGDNEISFEVITEESNAYVK